MKPRLSVLTLGVDDLEKSVAFYRDGLGLVTPRIVGSEFEHGAVAFFELQGGLKLALWPKSSLLHDSGLPNRPRGVGDVSLGHNVRTREEVDAIVAQVQAAGGRIVKPAADTFYGGYAAYFHDLDGHLWEIVWNPDPAFQPED